LGANFYEVSQREGLWNLSANQAKEYLSRLQKIQPIFPEKSIVDFINSPMPQGFLAPMLKVYGSSGICVGIG